MLPPKEAFPKAVPGDYRLRLSQRGYSATTDNAGGSGEKPWPQALFRQELEIVSAAGKAQGKDA